MGWQSLNRIYVQRALRGKDFTAQTLAGKKSEEESLMTIRNKGKRLNGYRKDYVVFDLETTGVNQYRDVIIEISAVKVCGGEIAGEYSTLVNPGRHIPAGATAVNGITDEMVKDAPDIKEAMEGFLEFIGSSVLVGHNIHTFDMNFAYDAAWQALGKELGNDYIDTLYMSRRCLPQLTHHKLTDISEYFHINTDGAHRAFNDCIMNQKCYEELGVLWQEKEKMAAAASNGKGKNGGMGGVGEGGDLECPSCGGILCLRKGKFGAFYGCVNFPSCRYTRNT